jgi:hypothetical protein
MMAAGVSRKVKPCELTPVKISVTTPVLVFRHGLIHLIELPLRSTWISEDLPPLRIVAS